MHPAVQHLGRVADAAARQRREQRHAEVGVLGGHRPQHVLRRGERCVGITPVQLVGLGQQRQQAHLAIGQARRHQVEQAAVEIGEAQPRVDHHHHAVQRPAQFEVLRHHLLPAQLGGALDLRVAVARQVGEQRVGRVLRAHLEQVDVLRAARRARGKGESLLLRQGVDGGGLAGIAAADEGDLGQFARRQLVQLARGGEETRGVGPRQRCLLCSFRHSGTRGRHGAL